MLDHSKYFAKIVLVGDGGIGKTTLLKAFSQNIYADNKITIGLDFTRKDLIINHIKISLLIWDLSGQKQFSFLIQDYLKGTRGVILSFDVSKYNTFLDLAHWMDLILPKIDGIPIILVGTKVDRGYHPAFSVDSVNRFIKNYNITDFIETSAKEEINVDLPFRTMAEKLIELRQEIR